jgi:hypothetical protein
MRLRDPGAVGERPHGQFTVSAEPLENRPAGGIGEAVETVFGVVGMAIHNPLVMELSNRQRHAS